MVAAGQIADTPDSSGEFRWKGKDSTVVINVDPAPGGVERVQSHVQQ